MDKIAKLPMQERQELIIATASKMKISEAKTEYKTGENQMKRILFICWGKRFQQSGKP